MSLSADSPRDGTVIATALLLGPLFGTALVMGPYLLIAIGSLMTPGETKHLAEAARVLALMGVSSLLFGFVIGAVPAALAGLAYAALRRALGERIEAVIFAALTVALPLGLIVGVSGGGAVGFVLIVGHLVLSALGTWGIATARWRRRQR